jgi:hypothetical protein
VQSQYRFFMGGVIPHQAGRKQPSWDERAWLRDERVPIGGEPPGSGVVDEGIVESFSDLVAQRGDIGEGRISEKARRDPAGIVHHITPLAKAVIGTAWLEIVGVEADDAALKIVFLIEEVEEVKEGVGEEEGGEVTRTDVEDPLSLACPKPSLPSSFFVLTKLYFA